MFDRILVIGTVPARMTALRDDVAAVAPNRPIATIFAMPSSPEYLSACVCAVFDVVAPEHADVAMTCAAACPHVIVVACVAHNDVRLVARATAAPSCVRVVTYGGLESTRAQLARIFLGVPPKPPLPPMFGRTTECESMSTALAAADAGHGGVLLLSGEPGIGKTRLAQELAMRARERDALVTWLHGREWRNDDGADVWHHVVTDLHGDSAAPATDHVAIVGTLRDVARYRLVVMILDDADAANDAMRSLLALLAPAATSVRLLVVVTYRAGTAQEIAELEERYLHRVVRLNGLAETDVTRYLEARGAPCSADMRQLVSVVTRGNPLFLEHVADVLLKVGVGTADVTTDPESLLGQSLHAIVGRRVEGLSSFCQGALEVAAVIGAAFDVVLLERVAHLDRDTLESLLGEATAAGLLVPTSIHGETFSFRHAVFQIVIARRVLAKRRRKLHQCIAQELAARHERTGHPGPTIIARHYLAAGNAPSASLMLRWLTLAVTHAVQEQDPDTAIALLDAGLTMTESALSLGARCDLQIMRAQAQWDAGRSADALSTSHDAMALAERTSDVELRARAALVQAGPIAGFVSIPYDEATATSLRSAIDALPPGDGTLRARLMARLAVELLFFSRTGPWALAQDAVDMASRLGDAGTLADVLRMTAWVRWPLLSADERNDLADDLVRLGRDRGDQAAQFDGHFLRCWHALEHGDYTNANQQLRSCALRAPKLRRPYCDWLARTAEVCLRTIHGQHESAEELMHQALDVGERDVNPNATLFFGVQQAAIWFHEGAYTYVRRALRGMGEQFPRMLATVRSGVAVTYAEEGRRDDACRLLEAMVPTEIDVLPRNIMWRSTIAFLAETAAVVGDAARASQLYALLEPYSGQYVTLPPAAVFGAVDLHLARAADAMGRPDLASRHYPAALELEARFGNRAWYVRTLVSYAEHLVAQGQPGDEAYATRLLRLAQSQLKTISLPALARRVEALASAHVPPSLPAAERKSKQAVMERDGEIWRYTYGDATWSMKPLDGHEYLATLVERPGTCLLAIELVRMLYPDRWPVDETADDGKLLRRIEDLRQQLAEAERDRDDATVERLNMAIEHEMTRLPPTWRASKTLEKARQVVRQRISGAIKAIDDHCSPLAAHLRLHLNCGFSCTYEPDLEHPVLWTVRRKR